MGRLKKYVRVNPQDHDSWLAERSKGIGGSEVGTIMGVNHFQTAYKLWRIKTHRDPAVEENNAMRFGHYVEDGIAQYFADETGSSIIKASAGDWIAYDPRKPHLRVSPDRLFYPKGKRRSAENLCALEIKSTNLYIDDEKLPQSWWLQLQYQMRVLGVQRGAICWLQLKTREIGYKFFDFDKLFFESTVEPELDKFWHENICKDIEPPLFSLEDVEDKFVASEVGSTKEADSTIRDAVWELTEVNKQYKAVSERKKQLEESIKVYLGGKESLYMKDDIGEDKLLATWKTPAKATPKFDSKRFQAEHPSLYNEYVVEVPGARRFSLKAQ